MLEQNIEKEKAFFAPWLCLISFKLIPPNHRADHSCCQLVSILIWFYDFNSSFPITVKITGRSNADDKNITPKSSLIYSHGCTLTGISRLFHAIQADGKCQSNSQRVVRDENKPSQKPLDTGHPDKDTARKYTGIKYNQATCPENTFLSDVMALCSITTTPAKKWEELSSKWHQIPERLILLVPRLRIKKNILWDFHSG